MTTQVQIRRGTSAEHAAFTGASGEITYDTTNKILRAHDGTTAGGLLHYRAGGTDVAVADGGTGASDAATARTNLGLGSIATLASPLPIANGGTASTTAANAFTALKQAATTTATGVVELATDAETTTGTDTTRAITPSNLTGAHIYGNIPQNSQSAAYQLVAADQSKHIFHPAADTTARIWTIPANATVAFPIGTTITFINQNGAGTITIAITTDTMRLAGAGTTGSRTLAANGIATAVKVTSTEWIISGTGLT